MRIFRFICAALALASSLPALAQNSVGAQSDVISAASLNLTAVCVTGTPTAQCPAGSVYELPIGNGQGVVAVDVTGLTGSGATVMVERTVGGLWSGRNLLVSGSAGAFAPSVSADASFTLNSVGSRAIRFRVSVAGTGTANIYASATANSSIVQFATSLPAGNLTLGGVNVVNSPTVNIGTMPSVAVSNFPAVQPVSQSGTWSFSLASGSTINVGNFPAVQTVSGTVAATQSGAWSVGITGTPTVSVSNFPATQPISGSVAVANFPASQAVTGTFWQATQPVSAAALPLPAGAATAALQSTISGQLPASLGAKTAATSLSIAPATDAAFVVQDANGGSLNTAETATNDASAALNPVTAVNTTAVLVATGARNFYSASVAAGSAGGYMVIANLAAIPASGTTLTPNSTMLKCVPAVSNLLNSFEPRVPYRASVGVVILFSQSCTTYTPVTTVAVAIDGRAL